MQYNLSLLCLEGALSFLGHLQHPVMVRLLVCFPTSQDMMMMKMMMMMMMMMMNDFCAMVDRRKAFSFASLQDHCHRSSPSRTSDTPLAGFEPEQNLSSGFVE